MSLLAGPIARNSEAAAVAALPFRRSSSSSRWTRTWRRRRPTTAKDIGSPWRIRLSTPPLWIGSADLLTCDAHFAELPRVVYFAKIGAMSEAPPRASSWADRYSAAVRRAGAVDRRSALRPARRHSEAADCGRSAHRLRRDRRLARAHDPARRCLCRRRRSGGGDRPPLRPFGCVYARALAARARCRNHRRRRDLRRRAADRRGRRVARF